MKTDMQDLTTVLKRLDDLEKQNRRMKQVIAVVVMIGAAIAGMAQVVPDTKLITAQEFRVEDEAGIVRAVLRIGSIRAPELAMNDESGKRRLVIGLGSDGKPYIFMKDERELERVSLAIGKDGPTLAIADSRYVWRTLLGLLPDDTPVLTFSDGKNKVRAMFRMTRDTGSPILALLDTEGQSRGLFALGNDQGPSLMLTDMRGYQTYIGVSEKVTPKTGESYKTSAASIIMTDKDKNIIWKAP